MWSRKHECCVGCGTADTPHMAKGLCQKCYLRRYQADPDHLSRHRTSAREWVRNNGKAAREALHFEGRRDEILQRDDWKCTRCGSCQQLVVHHIDGEGRGSAKPNNDPNNLTTLCRRCHMEIHGITYKGGSEKLLGWSRKNDCCTKCGSTSRHAGLEMCAKCYTRYKRARKQQASTP